MIRHHTVLAVAILFSLMIGSTFAQVATLGTQPTVETFDHAGSLPDGWRVIEGSWRVVDGVIVADSLQGEAYVAIGETHWQNYEVTADVVFRKVRDPQTLAVSLSPGNARRFKTVVPNCCSL